MEMEALNNGSDAEERIKREKRKKEKRNGSKNRDEGREGGRKREKKLRRGKNVPSGGGKSVDTSDDQENEQLNNRETKERREKSRHRERKSARILNDISDVKTKEKNVNITKEERRRKREKRDRSESRRRKQKESIELKEVEENQEPVKEEEKGEEKKECQVIGVVVHESEVLKMDFLVTHPIVKVSFFDGSTGKLLQKSDPTRKVTSYYEDEKVNSILPVMTQPYDFRTRKDVVPKWEELLLFNDDFNLVMEQNKNIVVFFELIDFVSMALANENYRKQKQKGGWYKIAWAFLKLRENEWRSSRLGEKVRLQLFKPGKGTVEKNDDNEVWKWWNSGKRVTYPSTLWVTIQPVVPPNQSEPTIRSYMATQPELGQQGSAGQYLDGGNSASCDDLQQVIWSRLPGQTYKVPKEKMLELDSSERGTSALAFSPDGRRLCVGVAGKSTCQLRVFDFPSGILITELTQLYGLVYQLHFHKDGFLAAAVGDGSVPIWETNGWSLVTRLSHPSYVYSAQFHPNTARIIASAGFDRVIRIWSQVSSSVDRNGGSSPVTGYTVIQELTGHNAHINRIAFDLDGHFLFSGDKIGAIRLWESPEMRSLGLESSTDSYSRPLVRDWSYKREYNVEETVCGLAVHPGGRRLLVHTLRPVEPLIMVDLRTGAVMQKYPNIQTFRLPGASCVSPCGTWVVGGSSCGSVLVWNTDNGEQQYLFRDLPPLGQISEVVFHPQDHMLAIASSEPFSKIFVFKHVRTEEDGEDEDTISDLGERGHVTVIGESRKAAASSTSSSSYPWKQVNRLIRETSDTNREEDARTPVDLQEIVEKLNNALREYSKPRERIVNEDDI